MSGETRTYTTYKEFCGNLEQPWVTRISEAVDWTQQETTRDQARIEAVTPYKRAVWAFRDKVIGPAVLGRHLDHDQAAADAIFLDGFALVANDRDLGLEIRFGRDFRRRRRRFGQRLERRRGRDWLLLREGIRGHGERQPKRHTEYGCAHRRSPAMGKF